MKKQRTYSEPFFIQMSSGDKNKQCDGYPHGSIHYVKIDEEGNTWLYNESDAIPKNYPFTIIGKTLPKHKHCDVCDRCFPIDWSFAQFKGPRENLYESCLRCYEKRAIQWSLDGFTRDDYRQLLRKEIILELHAEFNSQIYIEASGLNEL